MSGLCGFCVYASKVAVANLRHTPATALLTSLAALANIGYCNTSYQSILQAGFSKSFEMAAAKTHVPAQAGAVNTLHSRQLVGQLKLMRHQSTAGFPLISTISLLWHRIHGGRRCWQDCWWQRPAGLKINFGLR
jgi:hypothetical protein